MTRPFALFDAFTDVPFGGSQAAVVMDAAGLDRDIRVRIAREFGLPATGFVERVDGGVVTLQFFSAVAELPMCGHGTLCVVTHLVEEGLLATGPCTLRLPAGDAAVMVTRQGDRPCVMLTIRPARFAAVDLPMADLARHLGLEAPAFDPALPVEVAHGDFVHLVVPMADLSAMAAVRPDFAGLTAFCHAHGLETVALVCRDTVDPAADLHVRDFCPAVGVAESAAAGTTNAAVTAYLVRHGQIAPGPFHLVAEQGLELGRPSRVQSTGIVGPNGLRDLSVGGVATRIARGVLG